MIETWRETFEQDPERAVADLMSGRAGLGSDLRLDVPELLYQEFPDRPGEAPARERLDLALLAWLHAMRRDYPAQVRRLGYAVYGKRLCDALTAVHLLDLPRTNHQARETLDGWLRWLVPLRLAPERDPALECWRVLTRRQRDAAQTAAWLRLAADPRPEYLDVALAGLRGLPNAGDARMNQVLMLRGLLHHALAAYATPAEGRAFFNRQFAALRGRQGPFPRAATHWQQVLDSALEGLTAQTGDRKARALAESIGAGQAAGSRRKRATVFEPVSKASREALEQDIQGQRQPPERLAERLFAMLEQNRRYAQTTGESHFFVRTLHNLGSRLLARGDLPAAVRTRFGPLIEQALAWEPMNPFCWMLWADWFAASGRWDAREWVLRETVRLFPDNEPARVELARLLIRRGEDRWDEAERWLRQVVERSPGHEHSRVVLAGLLVRRDRVPEALTLLEAVLARNPHHPVARQFLARLRPSPDAPPDGVSDPAVHEALWHEESEAVAGEGGGFGSDLSAPLPGTPVSAAGADAMSESAALAEVTRRGLLGAEFVRALGGADPAARVAPSDPIAVQAREGDALAGLYHQWLQPAAAPEPPPNAWAWRACRLWQAGASAGAWDGLERDCPERRREIGFLRLLTPGPATDRTEQSQSWRRHYADPDGSAADPAGAFMRRMLESIPGLAQDQRADCVFAVLDSTAIGALELAA